MKDWVENSKNLIERQMNYQDNLVWLLSSIHSVRAHNELWSGQQTSVLLYVYICITIIFCFTYKDSRQVFFSSERV